VTFESWLTLIGGIFGGGFSGFAAARYLATRFIEHRLAKDLEQYRNELAERTESLKTQLSIRAHEESVTITRVDLQRSTAVAAVYAAISDWRRKLVPLVQPPPPDQPSVNETVKFYAASAERALVAADAVRTTLIEHAIYFDLATYEKIFQLVSDARRMTENFLNPIRSALDDGTLPERILGSIEVSRARTLSWFEKYNEPLQAELLADFRRLVGSERAAIGVAFANLAPSHN
jgi:hypothetical protein